MSADPFHLEVLKLLVHIAWADGAVDPVEIAAVEELAHSWSVDPAAIADITERMRRGQPRPPPNMQLLKARPDDVMDAVRKVVMSDGKLDLEELDVLGTVATMLGIPEN
jgi:uncharacterized tellurite resistance protein B-like protein